MHISLVERVFEYNCLSQAYKEKRQDLEVGFNARIPRLDRPQVLASSSYQSTIGCRSTDEGPEVRPSRLNGAEPKTVGQIMPKPGRQRAEQAAVRLGQLLPAESGNSATLADAQPFLPYSPHANNAVLSIVGGDDGPDDAFTAQATCLGHSRLVRACRE
jgi:hypothetical protein